MSRGPWKSKTPEEEPPVNRYLRISELHLELAALAHKRAQVEGELSEHYRMVYRESNGDLRPAKPKVA